MMFCESLEWFCFHDTFSLTPNNNTKALFLFSGLSWTAISAFPQAAPDKTKIPPTGILSKPM